MNARTWVLAAMVAAALPAAASNRIPVVDEGAIKGLWSLAPGTHVTPLYPQAYAQDNPQVCLTVGYLLDADGHASNFALLNSWKSGGRSQSDNQLWTAFAGSASQALSQWRFVAKPGIASPGPVYTAATFVFGPGDAVATAAHCATPDLAVRLVELRHDARANRLMAGGVFSRLDINPDVELKYEIAQQQLLAREGRQQAMMARQERDQMTQMQQQQLDQRAQQGSSGTK